MYIFIFKEATHHSAKPVLEATLSRHNPNRSQREPTWSPRSSSGAARRKGNWKGKGKGIGKEKGNWKGKGELEGERGLGRGKGNWKGKGELEGERGTGRGKGNWKGKRNWQGKGDLTEKGTGTGKGNCKSNSRKNDHEAKTYRFGSHLGAILAPS